MAPRSSAGTASAENRLQTELLRDELFLPPCYQAHPPRLRHRAFCHRIADDFRLLLLVALAGAGRRAGALRASYVAQLTLGTREQRLQLLRNKAPRSHIARLLL